MDPAIALQHGPLEVRPHYIKHLHDLRIQATSTSTSHIEECDDPRAHASDSPPDHIIKFHCQHTCGENEAKAWFADHNSCKECKTVLFQEVPVPNDVCNIRRTWTVMILQAQHRQNGNEDMAQRVHGMWRKLLDDRAEAFLEGKVESPKSAYGLYAVRTPLMTDFPPEFRRINADVMIPYLEKAWTTLLKTASNAAVANGQGSGPDIRQMTGLQAPCHPLAVKLLHHMIEVLRRYDGRLRRAVKFHEQLNDQFVQSEIYAHWHTLARNNEAPHGFLTYQRHLVEGVISEFTFMSELAAPQPRLGEWEVEEDELDNAAL